MKGGNENALKQLSKHGMEWGETLCQGEMLAVRPSRFWSCLKRNGVGLKRAEGEGGIREFVGRDGRVRVFGKGDQGKATNTRLYWWDS